MFILTLGGMVVSALFAAGRFKGRVLSQGLVLILAFLAGASPRAIGQWVEPYDAYHEQFAGSLDPQLLKAHSKILLLDCLPRLIVGHRLPGLEADPDRALLGTGGPVQGKSANRDGTSWWVWPLVVLGLGSFIVALAALAGVAWDSTHLARRAIAAGLLATAVAVVAGFLINRNIFNSDNYRYLVLLLVPWSVGLGLVLGCLTNGPASAALRGFRCGDRHGGALHL